MSQQPTTAANIGERIERYWPKPLASGVGAFLIPERLAAKILQLDRGTLSRARKNGLIGYYSPGRGRFVRYSRDNLEAAAKLELAGSRERLGAPKLARSARGGLRRSVWERDGGRCRYCDRDAGEKFHIDHVIPYSLGGFTEANNLVVACRECNIKKNGRTPAA